MDFHAARAPQCVAGDAVGDRCRSRQVRCQAHATRVSPRFVKIYHNLNGSRPDAFLPELNSEAISFPVASQSFAPMRKLNRA